MSKYSMSIEAAIDLEEVIQYSASVWGRDMTLGYAGGLIDVFNKIGSGEVIERIYDESVPKILVAKYRYHFPKEPHKFSHPSETGCPQCVSAF